MGTTLVMPNENQRQEAARVDTAVKIAELGRDVNYVKDTVDRIDKKVSQGYVTKEEFAPIKRLVYGVVSLVTIAVVGALMELVVRGGK
jgi:hypothetical protein